MAKNSNNVNGEVHWLILRFEADACRILSEDI